MTKLSDGLKSASDTTRAKLAAARSKATMSQEKAKQQASKALSKSKKLASSSMENTKKVASDAAAKTEEALDTNPLLAVMGGLALGLIAGALIPRMKSEEKLLGNSSKAFKEKAKRAADAAKEAGKETAGAIGLNGEVMRDQFRDLVAKAGEAVKAAGKAAGDSAKRRD